MTADDKQRDPLKAATTAAVRGRAEVDAMQAAVMAARSPDTQARLGPLFRDFQLRVVEWSDQFQLFVRQY